MRNKRETDISRYTDFSASASSGKADVGVKRFFKGLGKFLLTIFSVCFIALFIAGISLSIYIFTLASEPTGIDLKAKSLNQTSFIMVKDEKTGEFKQYQTLYSTENRIWVDNQNIPKAMKDAVISIEDKRFNEHNGVDWTRTLSAVVSLATGSDSYGGSTITQQLIKNVTDDNEVSITRKLREICKALKLENEYTKDQILEAYLNVVNFGNSCQGVEAAAQLYFDKSIQDCSIAQCAAIAGITQNPSLWDPLVFPENNQIRRELIINEMFTQNKITKSEFDKAMKESADMKFVGWKSSSDENDDDDDDTNVQNWYIDQVFRDLQKDLATYYNISEEAAASKLYTEGLKIYCAMDEKMQNYLEESALNIDKSYDSDLQIASTIMGFDGRVIATVGSSNKKEGALNWDRAYNSSLQPGSSIKPLLVYPIAINEKKLYYSSMILDQPLEKYEYDSESGSYKPGPKNAYGSYMGNICIPDAIEWSSNATAVQAMELIGGPSIAYEQAVTKMGFEHLSEQDAVNTGALSIGGMNGGVTVREMAAAYAYLGNGGLYYKPYTYYYVTDSEDNIIIDNRDTIPKQVYSAETAGIMNRLLHYNVENSAHTKAMYARITGWDIIGKTGTTDEDKDSWFCGLSPYAVMTTWCGFDQPHSITENGKSVSASFFAKVMGKYLEDKEQKDYKLPGTLVEAQYNPYTGLIVSTNSLYGKYIGYYTDDNMPAFGGAYDYNAGNSDSESSDNDGNYNNSDSSYIPDEENNSSNTENSDSSNSDSSESSGSEGGGEEPPAPPPDSSVVTDE